MGYRIYASLLEGKPQIEIVDVQSERTCVSWRYEQNTRDDEQDRHEFQRLFRDLLLLSCKQKLEEH